MKVALLGDVHANLPALEAVLAHAADQGAEAIWNIGDSIGYGAFPDEVVSRLRQANAVSIVGNYDLKALQVGDKTAPLPGRQSEKRMAFRFAFEHLSEDNRAYLRGLPQEIRLEVEGKHILLTHASPASNEEYLTLETPLERFRELAQLAQADVVICGHSHRSMRRKVDGVYFINTGSVGRPDDGNPRACYAILQISAQDLCVRHYRVKYDLGRAVSAIRQHKLPEAFAQMILQGRNLDGVMQSNGKRAPARRAQTEPSVQAVRAQQRKAALKLAQDCKYEVQHTQQVTRLALQLFDELKPVHRLGDGERFWLECAGLLHDIGWIEGQKAHHKTALRLILEAPILKFDTRERYIIGSIARYHRKALPDEDKHDHYATLKPRERQVVDVLAGLLRVADGLDRTHQSLVKSLACDITSSKIVVRCAVSRAAEDEQREALDKGELFERALQRKLVIEVSL